jgi:phosphatidylserine/phosphatidylglycerophosphate/cardiolipin synthase-like enzyme
MQFQKNQWQAWMIIGGLTLLGLGGCRRSPADVPRIEPLPQDPLIQVYFNHSQASSYVEPYRGQERLGDDLEQVMIEAIASAQSSIDIAVQELRLPRVAEALAQRAQSGVDVRLILENTYSRPLSRLTAVEVSELDDHGYGKYLDFFAFADGDRNGELSEAEINHSDALVIVQTAGIPWIDDTADGSAGSDLMHHKVIIVDRRIVIVGSANFTMSDTHGDVLNPASKGNVNHLLKIDSVGVARLFTQEFERMWGDGPGGAADSQFGLQKSYYPPQTVAIAPGSSITIQFSPTSTSIPWQQSVNGLIGQALSQANQSIDLALFVFSDQDLANVLQAQHRRGVAIRGLIDPGFIYRNYSEALDMLGVALKDNRCRYEVDNNPWASPITTIGMPALAEGDVLHHKFGLVDDRFVITGSQNWSNAANRGNDENLLVIQNSTVVAHFEREFERLYRTASLGITPSLQARIAAQNDRCPL